MEAKRPTLWVAYLRQHQHALLLSVKEIFRQPFLSLAITAVIGVLLIPIFLVINTQNLQTIQASIDNSLQINLTLRKTISESEVKALMNDLRQFPLVREIKYISAEEGLHEVLQSIHINGIDQALNQNPIPPSLVLKLKMLSMPELNELKKELQKYPAIDVLVMDQQWLQRLHDLNGSLVNLYTLLSLVMCVAVLILMTISLHTFFKDLLTELNLYDLLGTSTAFRYRPLLYLGSLIGLMGGIWGLIFSLILLNWVQPFLALFVGNATDHNLHNLEVSLKQYSLFLLLTFLIGWFTAAATVVFKRVLKQNY